MLALVFYVPETHKERVKQAVFAQGAGCYHDYDHCAWETLGTGQFRPLAGSQPFIGQQDQIETVAEYRVEMICSEHAIQAVLTALLNSHPYQTPAYQVYPIQTASDF